MGTLIYFWGPDALEGDAQNDGEAVVNLKDLDMFAKLHLDDADDDEPPPPSFEGRCFYVHNSDETPEEINYNSDDSWVLAKVGFVFFILIYF